MRWLPLRNSAAATAIAAGDDPGGRVMDKATLLQPARWRDRLCSHPLTALFVLLGAYYVAAKISIGFITLPAGVAVVWLPNAVLLFCLLRLQKARYWMLPFVILAEIAADAPVFPWQQAALLGIANIMEVTVAYLLMRRMRMSPSLSSLSDQLKFLLAGPVVGAFIGGLLGAAVIKLFQTNPETYLVVLRVWWFGDALGLLILTPLLLSLSLHGTYEKLSVNRMDWTVLAFTAMLLLTMFLRPEEEMVLTPVMLLPSVLYLAYRFSQHYVTWIVAIITLILVLRLSHHYHISDSLQSADLEVLRLQEFIFILAIMSMGFSALIRQIRLNEYELEKRVAQRTEELVRINDQLTWVARTDALTGLLNRRAAFDAVSTVLDYCNRYQHPLALLMLDLDHFKSINDRHGHQAGDQMLRALGQLLAGTVRSTDIAGRYGGEEFILVAPEMDAETARRFAERLLAEVRKLVIVSEQTSITATMSIGLAMYRPGDNLEQLLSRADELLYLAKARGRNQVATQ